MATAHRSRAVVVVPAIAVVALGLAVFQRGVVAADGPVSIPKEGEGYQISKTDSSQKAPSGYEGRTDTSTQTAVGNTPATMGKRVVSRFTLSNQIKTCPLADGAAEGEGVFSLTVDSTNAQASETSTVHIVMQAKAKYKGQVNDDAYLDGPVKAEIDYTYTQSGTIRGANGALATPAGSNVAQHVTIQFLVGKDMTAPDIGAFAGGDPTQGGYSDAFSAGTALAYWGGVYYSMAQTRWRQGLCAKLSFNPPSNTIQPALGTDAAVKVEVKSKSGEIVKGKFQNARAYAGGRINPPIGTSDVGSPLPFTYTAPNQKAASNSNAGFAVEATSRAGIALGEWHTNLGTGWSGQISCSRVSQEGGSNEQQFWSNYTATQLTIDLTDGVGTVSGSTEQNLFGQNLRPIARQGYAFDNSQSTTAMAEGNAPARVEVTFDETRKTYSISPEWTVFPPGNMHSEACDHRNGCRQQDQAFYVQNCLPHLSGTLTNPNELSGSMSDVKTGLGRSHNGSQSLNVTWHLARRGTH
jgi:hypothetical protein